MRCQTSVASVHLCICLHLFAAVAPMTAMYYTGYMKIKGNLLLLLTAAIWGFAFVAQRAGMEHVGPFTFNSIRFALGSLSLLPLILFFAPQSAGGRGGSWREAARIGALLGSVLFTGASLQQIGIIYTTAGKAAFITCMYIVLVPIAGIFLKQRLTVPARAGTILALMGLYLLCVKEQFTIAPGDLLELLGSFFWTLHILLIDYYSPQIDTLKLAFFQCATCALLSAAGALGAETITLGGIRDAGIPILYGGICSVGIAYTLQIVGQKHASPAHAAIILSMETVFAAIGGFLLLGERFGWRELWGCALMLAGMLLSQGGAVRRQPSANAAD